MKITLENGEYVVLSTEYFDKNFVVRVLENNPDPDYFLVEFLSNTAPMMTLWVNTGWIDYTKTFELQKAFGKFGTKQIPAIW